MFNRAPSRTRRDLHRITRDGFAWSILFSMTDSNLVLFALALGFGETKSGLVLTIPPLIGAIIQLAAPWGLKKVGSFKRWVVLCALVQALSVIPLIIAALMGHIPYVALIWVAAIYFGAGMATGPAWNTWVGALIPRQVRARYLSWRHGMIQIGVAIGLVIGGLLLKWGESNDTKLTAFAIVFVIGFIARMFSSRVLSTQTDLGQRPEDNRSVPVWEIVRRFRQGRESRLFVYFVMFSMVANFALPFFVPFLSKKLGFADSQVIALTGAAFVGKVFAMPSLGRFAQRYGAHRLLVFGSLSVAPLCGLWLVSGSFWYLLTLQVFAGVGWGAYELAVGLLVFEEIREDERTSILTIFNLANFLGVSLGSLVGAGLLSWFGESYRGYVFIFLLSVAARFVILPIVRTLPDRKPQKGSLIMRTVGVRPGLGTIERPVVSALESAHAKGD